ncbi:MAG TPA: helix-turn-helix domain-containing protein [Candidatus Eremiobacteraeota bacterium]|nr:MAG: hypothetical protein BWY64_00060 [bacterium ADurb.Bin363]HPZ06803.1 helix-turn-helix domain-containing protein [Candidatus Eremiobacteraeota bacterium]
MIREDPDNRMQNRLLSILRSRDQEIAQKKHSHSQDISPISILPARKEIEEEESVEERVPTEKILEYLEQNYQPVQDFFTMVDNFFFDKLCSNLSPSAQVVYLHLYRLSHGWNKPYCKVGKKILTDRTNMSRNTATKAIKELKDNNYIKEIDWDQDGTIYQILLPREIIGGSILGIPQNSIPKIGIETDSIPIFGIPKIGIPKIGIPEKQLKDNNILPLESGSIPKIGIPEIGILEKTNRYSNILPLESGSIPETGIPETGIPEEGSIPETGIPEIGIPEIGIPEEPGIPKIGILPNYIQKQNLTKSRSLGIDFGSIPKIDPIKYNNILKNTLSLKTWAPQGESHKEKNIGERAIKEIIEIFYNKLNQTASTEKKKKGEKEIKKLLEDGYSLYDISFAANWVVENMPGGEAPQSFALVPHCIDQALKERDTALKNLNIPVELRQEEKQKRNLTIRKKEEQCQAKDEGLYLDEYYNSLEDKEKDLLKNKAREEVEKTPGLKKVGYMTDILVNMKIREIVRNKYFNQRDEVR